MDPQKLIDVCNREDVAIKDDKTGDFIRNDDLVSHLHYASDIILNPDAGSFTIVTGYSRLSVTFYTIKKMGF